MLESFKAHKQLEMIVLQSIRLETKSGRILTLAYGKKYDTT